MFHLRDYLYTWLERAASYRNACNTKAVLLVCIVRREAKSLDMYVCLCVRSGVYASLFYSTLPC